MKAKAPEPEVRWDRMTAPALRTLARQKTVVIIPLGATEQHGPHLPVQVDWRLAYEVSLRAARLGRLSVNTPCSSRAWVLACSTSVGSTKLRA